ncbi:hypothetical protein QAD02_010676 [Eretmocerus hayati]|uniref:Uncharacterized protein n=1 Tax=Eretmocerus hayati TaxID=131215 RepID=A0ACC2NUG1_9HYME|nr:hypothetical protein QAD02_010676 [Eretmocerus hayati]
MYQKNDEYGHHGKSKDVENIVIKPDSIEILTHVEDPFWLEDDNLENNVPEIWRGPNNEYLVVTLSGEVIAINIGDLVQAPFCLENYFMDYNDMQSSLPLPPHLPQKVAEIDRVTCYECDIVFCNEQRLLEHLMTHININRMGCDICDKDLNLEEKFQLHAMAVTWQSIYYCDYCRKSCAGVVRSKDQVPPPGKTFMCHDCECEMKKESLIIHNNTQLYDHKKFQNVTSQPKSQPVLPPAPQVVEQLSNSLPKYSSMEVLKDHKQVVVSSKSLSVPSPMEVLKDRKQVEFSSKPLPASPPTEVLKGHKQVEVSSKSPATPLMMEVLKDQKQMPKHETKSNDRELSLIEQVPAGKRNRRKNGKSQVTKENNKHRRPKPGVQTVSDNKNKKKEKYRRLRPKVQAVNESMKHTLKMSTRSRTREQNKLPMRNFKCRYCPNAFRGDDAFLIHLKEKHEFHKLRYICKLCGKDFRQQRCYENHVSLHKLSENHMCRVCNFSFLSKRELEQHAREHDESEFTKTYCNPQAATYLALDLRKKRKKITAR